MRARAIAGAGRPAPPRRLPALVGSVLALLVLLTGCSTGADPATQAPPGLPKYYDARQLLGAVSVRERTDAGAATTLGGTVAGPAGRSTVTGEGVLRFSGDAVDVRFSQRVAAPGAPPRTTGLVRAGGRTYLQATGGRWAEIGRVPMADADVRADATLATNIADMADPLAGIRRYADASLVADATDDTVDDTRAVRYTLVVDLVRAAAAEPDPALRAQLNQQVGQGLTRISSELWLDADQRPVRTRIRRQVPGAGALDLVTDYRSWGTRTAIDPPSTG